MSLLIDVHGKGPFEVRAIEEVSKCTCGRVDEYALHPDMEDWDEPWMHDCDCALQTEEKNSQILYIFTEAGDQFLSGDWFEKAA